MGPQQWYERHQALYEALLAEDITIAQELMREHLQRYIREGFIPVAE